LTNLQLRNKCPPSSILPHITSSFMPLRSRFLLTAKLLWANLFTHTHKKKNCYEQVSIGIALSSPGQFRFHSLLPFSTDISQHLHH
jgi:hypothetical protein